MNIWQELQALPRPFFILAPMEAVTDTVFRRVVAKAAKPDLFFTEFTNATGWVHAGEKAVAGRLTVVDNAVEQPIVAQIWGGVPEDIGKLAAHCKELGYQGIDINMGCPASSALKGSGGSDLIRNPELASEIIAAAKTTGLPVSVKTRLGYSKPDEWPIWLEFLLQQDIVALTIHLRSKKEMSKVPAHWELMPEIKKLRDSVAPHTLLIGNGDVEDRNHGLRLAAETGIDGIMMGRGIFTNIFAFEHTPAEHTQEELLGMLDYHLDLFEEHHYKDCPELVHGEFIESTSRAATSRPKPYETLKRFFKIYVRDFPGSAELRAKLMETNSISEARTTLHNHK